MAAAEALDRAGQRRLLTPDKAGYWVKVRGGKIEFGNAKAYQSMPVGRGKKEIKAFQMARFPVTVWEYGQFLEHGRGVQVPKAWEEQVKHPGRPVVGVDWHDARRYCREWAKGDLPTDEQWEFAARGEAGRISPWGSAKPSDLLANFAMEVGEPSPVGLFPAGATPEGVEEMAGNVWE